MQIKYNKSIEFASTKHWPDAQTTLAAHLKRYRNTLMHKYIIKTVIILSLSGCANSYYGYEKETWENMSKEEQTRVIDEIYSRLQDNSENDAFHNDIESITDWVGKHRN